MPAESRTAISVATPSDGPQRGNSSRTRQPVGYATLRSRALRQAPKPEGREVVVPHAAPGSPRRS